MRFAQDAIGQDVDKIRDTAGELPPRPVLSAVLALTRGQADHVIALYESADGGTTWHVVGSVGRSLVVVDASSPRSEWTLDNSRGDGLADDDQLDARLRRLDDVAAVQVVGTTNFDIFGDWSFNARWRLTLRDGTPVDIGASWRTNTAREACDEFARHVIDAITST